LVTRSLGLGPGRSRSYMAFFNQSNRVSGHYWGVCIHCTTQSSRRRFPTSGFDRRVVVPTYSRKSIMLDIWKTGCERWGWIVVPGYMEGLSPVVLEECCFSLARGIIIVIIPPRQSAVEAKKIRLIHFWGQIETDDLRLRHASMGENWNRPQYTETCDVTGDGETLLLFLNFKTNLTTFE
jgi:hypothetical protein